MSIGFLIVMLIIVLIIAVLIAYTYYTTAINFVSIFNKKNRKDYSKKVKILYVVLSLVFTALTVNLFGILGIVLLHFIVFIWLLKLINIIIKRLFHDKDLKIWEIVFKSQIIPAIFTAIAIIYGYYNINNIVKTEYTIYSDKIDEEIKVLFIADLHYGTNVEKEELDKLYKIFCDEHADVFLLGGDIVDEATTYEEIIEVYEVLSQTSNKYGIWAVHGNHDRQQYSNNPMLTDDELEDYVQRLNYNVLEDASVELMNGLVIMGRRDVSSKDRLSLEEIDNPFSKEKYIILLDHQPRDYDEASEYGVDLVLSGHTHAGQIFPIGIFTTLVGGAEQNYGKKEVEEMTAIVTSGVNGWGFPIRTAKHCEYVVINIKPEN